MKKDTGCILLFYYRHVYNIIIWVQKKDIDTVINIFNSYDSNLQFTFELEHDKRLNFLDMT